MRDGGRRAKSRAARHDSARRVNSQVLIPSARRLMTSLRGLPYDLPGAVADLVDNSLDAEAGRVDIDLGSDWRGAYVRIADNGLGMSERELDEAMRYGSARAYDSRIWATTDSVSRPPRSVSAAASQSRPAPRSGGAFASAAGISTAWPRRTAGARAARRDGLPSGTGRATRRPQRHRRPLGAADRVLGERRLEGDAVRRRLHSASEEIAVHLAMAFHRFVAGDAPGPRSPSR